MAVQILTQYMFCSLYFFRTQICKMTEWIVALSAAPVGAAILISYVMVLMNACGGFELYEQSTSYIDSPYWLGADRGAIIAVVVFQALAAIGYVMWMVWMIMYGAEITNSVLQTRTVRLLLIHGFLLASIAWPYTAYFYMLSPSTGRAILTSVPLWVAAGCVIVLIGGTFEAGAPWYAVAGILMLGTVVVLADGVGWSAMAIKRTI